MSNSKVILSLWFDRLKTKTFRDAYFVRDPLFDAACRSYEPNILKLVQNQAADVLKSGSREMTLASILLVDQFSRNIWRGKQAEFVYSRTDPIAQRLANYYIEQKWHETDDWASLAFVLLPLEHSEREVLHLQGISIWTDFMSRVTPAGKTEAENRYQFFKLQLEHFWLIQRFGRYPHRVESCGGVLTDEEKQHLATSNSRFGTDS